MERNGQVYPYLDAEVTLLSPDFGKKAGALPMCRITTHEATEDLGCERCKLSVHQECTVLSSRHTNGATQEVGMVCIWCNKYNTVIHTNTKPYVS
jgi:hypothetical protein